VDRGKVALGLDRPADDLAGDTELDGTATCRQRNSRQQDKQYR